MNRPPNFLQLLIFSLILIVLLILIQVGVISLAMDRLGLSQQSVILILFCSLFGSLINLPLFTLHQEPGADQSAVPPMRILFGHVPHYTGNTIIAINVGGAMMPIFICLYLLKTYEPPVSSLIPAILIVSSVSYIFSRPVQGIGIGIPVFIAPFTAALIAILLEPATPAPLAYIAGTLGILIGADIMRLHHIRHMATPVASIGGAGTFDGIFLTGIFAVLLTK